MADLPDKTPTHPTLPPEAWSPASRWARSVRGSIDRYLHVEAAGGIVLLVAAAGALLWANSPWGESYDTLWHTHVAIGIGDWRFDETLQFWVNELLMTVFFLVVGLEIKREIAEGALSDMRRATLPIAAALGGMLVPALVYLSINPTGPQHEGWGVPMATDIAFAVGVLSLLGKRIPATLRVLILAIAIIDDIGAILVIALFYASGFAVDGLVVAALGLLLLFLLLKIGVRPGLIFAVPILIMWAGMLRSGIHPTIAGVIAGLCAPAKSWYGKEGFLKAAREVLDEFQSRIRQHHDDHELFEPLGRLARARREALSPALRAEVALHPWVAYVIMPLFALANAGVDVRGIDLQATGFVAVSVGVILGLVVGKPLGIMLLSWVAVRLKLCSLPDAVTWPGMFVAGAGAGIGFTMAIFIAELAFSDPAMLSTAKLSILIATVLAGTIALVAGRIILTAEQPKEMADATATDVESDTEFWTGNHMIPEES
ncbi:MAG: sodium:proton antiporter [Gemmatimonas sp. SG8_17]|nr:MAG: sodium:proton antiporter [Gemmatimonas sp. SG8_17]